MGFTCCAVGCHNRQGQRPGLSFYRFPTDPQRREKWIAAVKRVDWQPTQYSRLCSDHFISGAKSNHSLSPDFIPNVFEYVPSPLKRRAKQQLEKFHQGQCVKQKRKMEQDRSDAADALLKLMADTTDSKAGSLEPEEIIFNETECRGDFGNSENCAQVQLENCAETQTDLTMGDIAALELDLQNLRTEIIDMKTKMKNNTLLEARSFENCEDKVKTFTGLPSFMSLMALFNAIRIGLKDNPTLNPFQQFILTCMRLRLNFTVSFLAYSFGVSSSTVSRVFTNVINLMNTWVVPHLVKWPEREQL